MFVMVPSVAQSDIDTHKRSSKKNLQSTKQHLANIDGDTLTAQPPTKSNLVRENNDYRKKSMIFAKQCMQSIIAQ